MRVRILSVLVWTMAMGVPFAAALASGLRTP